MKPVEYHEPIVDKDLEDSNHEDENTQTAENIVSDSLARGALSEVCEVTAVMRELDDMENDLVKEFVSQGCSASCDFGPKKTPFSMLFPIEHCRSLRATFAEMSHDELELFVMGQIMADCYQSTTLHSSSPEQRNVTYGQFYHQGQPTNLLVPPQHWPQEVQEHQEELPHEWTSCEGTWEHGQKAKAPPNSSTD